MDPVDISEDAYNILEAVPFPIFVMDVDLCIMEANRAARDLSDMAYILRRLCGEVLHCVHERRSGERCGKTEFCSECAIRNAVGRAWSENRVVHVRQEMLVQRGEETREVFFKITAAPFDRDRRLLLLILEDVSEVMDLRRIVPICAGCKKVRNDRQFWEQVESYFTRYANVDFSHGLCPECAEKFGSFDPGTGP